MSKVGAYKDRHHKLALVLYTLRLEQCHTTMGGEGTGDKTKKPSLEPQRGIKLMLLHDP